MWVAKIIIPAKEGMLLASRAKKHNVSLIGYPLSYYEKNNKVYFLTCGYIIGDEENKKAFLKDLKKDKRTIKIDKMDKNFGFCLLEQNAKMRFLCDPLIIHVKPSIISKNGDNIFEIASWKKEKLVKFAKVAKSKNFGGKLVYIKQKIIKNISVTSIMPELTEKQKRALELAIENGYYNYPRKIESQQLAKLMKISPSTYQFHLRNAEKKVMPFVYQNS